jgi:SAM-dependent methyltransferase
MSDPGSILRTPERSGAHSPPAAPGVTLDDVLRYARELYAEGPFIFRHMQRLRPYICPFEPLIEAVPADSRVLDVGCGAGLFLGLLAKSGRLREGRGFDLSAPAILSANAMKQRLGDENLHFERVEAGAPWPAGPFDLVSMIDVMHHVPPAFQAGIFPQVADRLRPGGLFVYKDMAARPLWQAWGNRLHDLLLAREWIHYLPLADAIRLAREAGLEVVRQDAYSRFWYAHEFVLFRRTG